MTKKPISCLLMALAMFLAGGLAAAQTFDIEVNPSFKKLPPHVEGAIVKHKGAYDEDIFAACRLYGVPISLSGAASSDGYIASTNGCGGGSAAFPVWLVRLTDREASVVLNEGATLLKMADTTSHGLRDILLTQGNAGTCGATLFKFDGKRYVGHKQQKCSR